MLAGQVGLAQATGLLVHRHQGGVDEAELEALTQLRIGPNQAALGFGDVPQALGESGILPVTLAASAPAAAAILLGMTLVFHQEDG